MVAFQTLTGRIILITGGGSGLGRAAAESAATAGAQVIIADIDAEQGSEVAEDIGGTFIHLDVVDEDGWKNLEGIVRREFGGLDVAILAAGVGGPYTPVSQMCYKEWRQVMAVNLDGGMLGIRSAFRLMLGRGGSIITVASTTGVKAFKGFGAYSASKAGIRQLTRVAALEGASLKPAVRVNCIVPGPIDTPLLGQVLNGTPYGSQRMQEYILNGVPLKRFGRPDEFGAVACFLASDNSCFITGTELTLDGGQMAG